jgi:hypothetical protein
MSDFTKIDTPRGVGGRSMTPLSPTNISISYGSPTGNFSGDKQDWFGPRLPIQPIAPPEVAGRIIDYTPGFNLNTEPRPYEPVQFHTLRMLAEAFDPIRIIIERRKDQVCRLGWTVRVKHEGNGKRLTKAQLPASTRERIKAITNLFQRPAPDKNFRSFLRGVLEDLYVIDAPAIYLRRGWSGNIVGLQQIDGALIKRVIDDWGRTPEPIPWNGKPYDWCGQTVTLENHVSLGFKIINGFLMPPAYQEILKGLPAVNYTTHDMIYRPLNIRPGHFYGMSPVEQVIMTVNIAMRRALGQLEYFKEGNQPDAVFGLPSDWTPDQISRFQDYWDNLYSGNLGNRRKMKFVAGDGNYTPMHEPPLKTEIDEWLVRIICAAFSYPPAAFVSLSNRSIAEQHDKTSEEEGLQTSKQWVCDLFNEIIAEHLDEDELEFAWAEED